MHSTDAKAPQRQLRSFAFIFAGVFLVIALWPTIFRWEMPRLWPLVPSGLFVAWGLLHPDSLQGPFRAWMAFGNFLGKINSKIILSAVFFVIITPIRIVMAMFGRDPMNRRLDPKADTYRVPRQPRPPSHMSRQF